MKHVALIMAGGRGTRLWPLSTVDNPKQFMSFFPDGSSLLQCTFNRLRTIYKEKDIFFICAKEYVHFILEQISNINIDNIIEEPSARNTAPAIALATMIISERLGSDVVLSVFPSDHIIVENDKFANTLEKAVYGAEQDFLMTIGVIPRYPETGFGYIQIEDEIENSGNLIPVKAFVEKPNSELAKLYCLSRKYFWNAGMFSWKASTFLEELRRYADDIFCIVKNYISSGCKDYDSFCSLRSVSIDYALMEKSRRVSVTPSLFDWDDAGSFQSFYRHNIKDENNNVVINKGHFELSISNCDSCLFVLSGDNDGNEYRFNNLENIAYIRTPAGVLVLRMFE